MRRDKLELIRYLDKDRNIVISTSGTLIGDTEVELPRKFHYIITVCISLDGSKEIREAIRRVFDSYGKVVRAIKALALLIPVTVTCSIIDDNLKVLPGIVDQYVVMGVKKTEVRAREHLSG